LKTKFIDLVKTINRDGILELLKWIESKSDFFETTCSTKYHNNFYGGLVDHSVKVYELFKEKCDYWRNKNLDIFLPDDDSIKIQALFHDICKSNFYTQGSRNVKNETTGKWEKKPIWETNDKFPVMGHGLKSVIMLQNFIKLKDYEIYSISSHMGVPDNYRDSNSFHKSLELYPFIILLHTSDFESSVLLEKTIK